MNNKHTLYSYVNIDILFRFHGKTLDTLICIGYYTEAPGAWSQKLKGNIKNTRCILNASTVTLFHEEWESVVSLNA